MDPPADDTNLKPETLEEEKESGPLFQCEFFDMDMVYKIGQSLLPGLASACIDNTIGGLFKTPASVAVDLRREMVDYLTQRSESFMAESVVLEGGPDVDISVDPYDTISDFVDDFVSSKRNFVSRVSGWIMSEKREDWIDDLVQEMELNGFWLSNQRNSVGQTLLKNLDFKNTYHCNMSFRSLGDLERHKLCCGFRTMACESEGCDAGFSAAQLDHHDSVCLFKILPCEQNCGDSIMRREMDRHCITICPMKLVKCPFHSMGCHITIPQSKIGKHRMDGVYDHLIYILQVFHKDASLEILKERVKELETLSSLEELALTRDARSLTNMVKRLEARLGPLKVRTEEKQNEEDTDLVDEKQEEKASSPNKQVECENSFTEKEDETVNSHPNVSDHQLVESPSHTSSHSRSSEEKIVELASVQEENPKEESSYHASSHSQSSEEKMVELASVQEENPKEESSSHASSHSRSSEEKMVELASVQEENPKEESSSHASSHSRSSEEKMVESAYVQEENPKEESSSHASSHSRSSDEKMVELASVQEENPKEESSSHASSHSRSSEEKMVEIASVQEVNQKESLVDLGSPTKNVGGQMETLSKEEDLSESPFERKEEISSPTEKADVQIENLSREVLEEVPIEKKEDLDSPIKNVDQMENLLKEENFLFEKKDEDLGSPAKEVDEHVEELSREGNLTESPHENKEGDLGSPTKTNDELIETLSKEESVKELSLEKEEDLKESQSEKEVED